MTTSKFKTNIKCGGCIATVTPALNQLSDIDQWEVDINSPDKILTIKADDTFTEQELNKALNAVGYQATKI